jgi:hypothetical protein
MPVEVMAESEKVRPRVVLASIPFFAEVLDGEEIDILGGSVTPRSLPAGEVLIREDDSGDSLFVIVSGEVDVSVGDGGAARRDRGLADASSAVGAILRRHLDQRGVDVGDVRRGRHAVVE